MLFPIIEGSPVAKITSFHYITMPKQIYTDLCAIVDHFDTEVSGCGMVERIEHRFKADIASDPDTVEIEFKILEIFLPEKQTNTRASTDIDEEEIFELQNKLIKEGKNTELLRLHWHSHADMDTFHSGTDEENYATLSGGDFLVSLVLNKAHKFLGRLDYFKPVRVMLSNLSIQLVLNEEGKVSPVIAGNINKLDVYEKEQKSKEVITTYNTSHYVGGVVEEEPDKETQDILSDMEIARQLCIPIGDAMRYRNCFQLKCDACKDVTVCHEYLYHIDKLSMYP